MASLNKSGLFYLTGLGLLMKDVTFTQEERMLLEFLCKHAAKSDEEYLKAIKIIRANQASLRLLNQLIRTLRSLGKEPELRAYYDRAA